MAGEAPRVSRGRPLPKGGGTGASRRLDYWTSVVRARRWAILALAAAALLLSAALGAGAAQRLSSGGFEDPASESADVERAVQERLGFDLDPGMVVLARAQTDVTHAPVRGELERLSGELLREPDVGAVLTHYAGPPGLISRDRRSTYLLVHFRTKDLDRVGRAAQRLRKRLHSSTLDLTYGGYGVWFSEGSELATRDLRRAELIVLPVLALLLVVVFRGLVAAALPLALAAFALLGTTAALRLIDGWTDLSVYALNLASPLSLGLAVDYSLFMVWRYREELGAGGDPAGALRVTLATAGRTVVFSSLTVAGAMAALLVFPQQFLYSMGIAGIFVALFAGAAALTVVPAALAVLGPRIDALSWQRPADAGRRWQRLPRAIVRRPGIAAATAVLILLVVAAPVLRATFTTFDTDVLPAGSESRQVRETIRADFPAFHDSPNLVLVRGRAARGAGRVAATRRRLASLDGAGGVTLLARLDADAVLFEAVSRHPPLAEPSLQLVERIRDLGSGVEVAGQTAEFVDGRRSIGAHLPAALLVIALATIPLLMAMTRSAVLPLLALALNAGTVVAALGFLVFVFQDGRFQSLLDYRSQGGIEINQAVLLLAVIFGVSTDYGVFLLARVREFLDQGRAYRDATLEAVLRTGRLITAAAAVVCVAVGALATSSLVFLKADGLGIAFAIGLDATLIRFALIPALLVLLGRHAWWAPRLGRPAVGRPPAPEASD
ncbi:MAG TPA: MMPL family transporter [Solirubrobacteraceae bacterium]|nr:MMPL family transporter [Solirubrobacteraceae bacterium]